MAMPGEKPPKNRVVGGARLELARLAAYAPQTYVSANSTTRPRVTTEGGIFLSASRPWSKHYLGREDFHRQARGRASGKEAHFVDLGRMRVSRSSNSKPSLVKRPDADARASHDSLSTQASIEARTRVSSSCHARVLEISSSARASNCAFCVSWYVARSEGSGNCFLRAASIPGSNRRDDSVAALRSASCRNASSATIGASARIASKSSGRSTWISACESPGGSGGTSITAEQVLKTKRCFSKV